MKWTERDSAYLSVVVVLLAVLGVLVAKEFIGSTGMGTSANVTRSSTTQILPSGEGVLPPDDQQPVVRTVPVESGLVESRTIEITPDMTAEEIAKALNMRVEDLPPRYRQGDGQP